MESFDETAPLTVTKVVTLGQIDPTGTMTTLEAELHYDPRDPYAVTTIFENGARQVVWTFGRDLLSRGLHEPSGDGDVHVWSCSDSNGQDVVMIELHSPSGGALLQAAIVGAIFAADSA